MTKYQRKRLELQFDRLIAAVPPEVAAAAQTDFGVFTSRLPDQYRAKAEQLRQLAARIANDNGR